MSAIGNLRKHPRYWLTVELLLASLLFLYFFQFYSGIYPLNPLLGLPVHADPIEVATDSLDKLSLPPIIVLPAGSLPLNVTYSVDTNGPNEVFMYWYQFANSTIHKANLWEPVYVYWNLGAALTSGGNPKLYAIALRLHFAFRVVYGGFSLNGTQPIITFSPGVFIPTVSPRFFIPRASNTTILSSYQTILDPNSPYATGPNAYQIVSCAGILTCGINGGGPIDPWFLINSPATIQNGILYGSVIAVPELVISKFFVDYTIHPQASGRRRVLVRVRKDLFAKIIEALD